MNFKREPPKAPIHPQNEPHDSELDWTMETWVTIGNSLRSQQWAWRRGARGWWGTGTGEGTGEKPNPSHTPRRTMLLWSEQSPENNNNNNKKLWKID